jgi:syntaxin 5
MLQGTLCRLTANLTSGQIADQLKRSAAVKPFAAVVPPPRAKSTFTLQSGEIRKYLNATTSKLERLAKLASSKSVFDDPTSEIEELSFVVKGDIKQLQSRVQQLQQAINEKKMSTAGNAQVELHSQAVVGAMQHQLMKATNGFKDVLMSRAENMKSQQDRRGQFGGAGSAFGAQGGSAGKFGANIFAASPPPGKTEMRERKPLMGARGGASLSHLDVEDAEDPYDDDDDSCVINVPSMEQMKMVPANSYGESRAEAVESIQKTMLELGEVYQQLNGMLLQQREMVDTIDGHVEDTVNTHPVSWDPNLRAMILVLSPEFTTLTQDETTTCFFTVLLLSRNNPNPPRTPSDLTLTICVLLIPLNSIRLRMSKARKICG